MTHTHTVALAPAEDSPDEFVQLRFDGEKQAMKSGTLNVMTASFACGVKPSEIGYCGWNADDGRPAGWLFGYRRSSNDGSSPRIRIVRELTRCSKCEESRGQ